MACARERSRRFLKRVLAASEEELLADLRRSFGKDHDKVKCVNCLHWLPVFPGLGKWPARGSCMRRFYGRDPVPDERADETRAEDGCDRGKRDPIPDRNDPNREWKPGKACRCSKCRGKDKRKGT